MEEILSRQDPQAHLAAIMRQADEAEQRLRQRLRQGPSDPRGESYLDALRSAHRDTRSPPPEEWTRFADGNWKMFSSAYLLLRL